MPKPAEIPYSVVQDMLQVCRELDRLDWCIGYDFNAEENHVILDRAMDLARKVLVEIGEIKNA